MSTKDNILTTALKLFNDEGTSAVSTNHIADAAGISPGNLYYHFHNKEEIIRELFERMFAATDAGFNLPTDKTTTLDDLQQYVRFNYKTLWAYRFAYRELAALLRSDPELRTNFLAYRKRGFAGFDQLFDAFVSASVVTAPKNSEIRANLAETIWLISEFWLNSLEIGGKPVNETQMERGVQLMMQVLEPYINKP